jgi:hypothetical protein
MQEQPNEPQVKSKRLRELLNRQSQSRSITPSRSDISQTIYTDAISKIDDANCPEKSRSPSANFRGPYILDPNQGLNENSEKIVNTEK